MMIPGKRNKLCKEPVRKDEVGVKIFIMALK